MFSAAAAECVMAVQGHAIFHSIRSESVLEYIRFTCALYTHAISATTEMLPQRLLDLRGESQEYLNQWEKAIKAERMRSYGHDPCCSRAIVNTDAVTL